MNLNMLVTGATGNVGREVIWLLSTQNHHVYAAVRNPIEAQKSLGEEAFCVLFDFTNPDTFASAFNGINKLFLVHTTTRFGLADTVTSDVQRLLDRPPLSMENYVEDYQHFWLKMPPEPN
jgi:uncharacterized protein YbjT (DUF2867 family)